MDLYTEKAIKQLEQEIEGLQQEIKGFENFRQLIKEKKPSSTSDYFTIFHVSVWNDTVYSDLYDDHNSKEAFCSEFNSVIGSENREIYLEMAEAKVQGREATVSVFSDTMEELQDYCSELEQQMEKVEDTTRYEFETWPDIESSWNRLRLYEQDLENLAESRQERKVFDQTVREYMDTDVEWPILADIGVIRKIIDEKRSFVVQKLPVEDRGDLPESWNPKVRF